MKYTSIDTIVRGWLLRKRWPMHFYIESIANASRCIEELNFDTMGIIRTVKIPINSHFAAPLPCDYLDFCKVGIARGQFVMPLSQRSGMNRLGNFDEQTGEQIPYSNEDQSEGSFQHGYGFGFGNFTWFNDNHEAMGRNYGSPGNQTATFKVLIERNEIQLDNSIDATHIILEYMSDGSECDGYTKIHPYAKKTIESFMDWMHKENSRSYGDSQRQIARRVFEHDHKILRARLSPLTPTDIKTMFRRRTHGSIK